MQTITYELDKIAQLCTIITNFSADAHWDYQIVRFAATQQELLAKAEQYDIRDEELFEQFETFLSGYKELVEALKISIESLSEEGMQNLGDLVNTLETRYERIQSNEYLNVSPEQGFDEEFDPVKFRELLANMVEDANDRFQSAVGDIDVSALKKLEIAKDLNQDAIDRGDTKLHFTGDKIEQLLRARSKYLDQIKWLRKFAKNSPEYQRLIETSRHNYRMIMEDPVRREEYRIKSRSRQKSWYGRTEKERGTEDPTAREEKRMSVVIERAKKLREEKAQSTLSSYIIHLTQRLASLKSDKQKSIKKNPPAELQPIIDATNAAKQLMRASPSHSNKSALEAAIKKEDQAIRNHYKSFFTELINLYALRDKLKQLDETGWLELPAIPIEVRAPLNELRTEVRSIPKMVRGVAEILILIAQLIERKFEQ